MVPSYYEVLSLHWQQQQTSWQEKVVFSCYRIFFNDSSSPINDPSLTIRTIIHIIETFITAHRNWRTCAFFCWFHEIHKEIIESSTRLLVIVVFKIYAVFLKKCAYFSYRKWCGEASSGHHSHGRQLRVDREGHRAGQAVVRQFEEDDRLYAIPFVPWNLPPDSQFRRRHSARSHHAAGTIVP